MYSVALRWTPNPQLLIILGCFFLSGYLYALSLQAAINIDHLHTILTTLASYVLWSCALFSMGTFFLLSSHSLSSFAKVAAFGLVAAIQAFQMLGDLGWDIFSHGGYNSVGFLLLAPLFSGFLFASSWIVSLLFRRPDLRPKVALGYLLLVGLFYGRMWSLRSTLDAVVLDYARPATIPEPDCEINFSQIYPWKDFIPGVITVPASLGRCRRVPQFARLEPSANGSDPSDRMLNITCDTHQMASFTILPPVHSFGLSQKHYLDRTIRSYLAYQPYRNAVLINAGEAVVARCGDSTNYLIPAVRKVTSLGNKSLPKSLKPTNVLVILLDGVSRLQFRRLLPRTLEFLRKTHATPNGSSFLYELLRYHVVGTHTGPNTRPMFTGSQSPRSPSVWNTTYKTNFVTAMSSGLCEDWSTTYRGRVDPFDYEFAGLACLPEYHDMSDPHTIFRGPFSIFERCLGGRPMHQYQIDHVTSFWKTYKAHHKFSLMLLMEGHEATSSVLGLSDNDLYEFLSQKIDLENTFVMFVADHGLHQGLAFLYTAQGQLEHRLPVFYLLAPRRMERAYKNEFRLLKRNRNALVTAWDIHKTLIDLHRMASGAPLEENRFVSSRRNKEEPCWAVARSLFEPIDRRNCTHVCIPDEMCICGFGK